MPSTGIELVEPGSDEIPLTTSTEPTDAPAFKQSSPTTLDEENQQTKFNISETDVFADHSQGAFALRHLMTMNSGQLPPEGNTITEQQRRRLEANSHSPWKRAPNTSTTAPNAESLVARSLLRARPPVFSPPPSHNSDLTELHWDEEGPHAHWPIDDDTVFYRMSKLETPQVLHDRSGEGGGGNRSSNKAFDLNIVMPMVIPGAEIRVLNSDGENYYDLAESNPGAHILFGCTKPTPKTPKNLSESETIQSTEDKSGSFVVPDTSPQTISDQNDSQNDYPAACDIWASFLNVHLGVIKNCRSDQIPEICSMFSDAFSDDLTHFMVPVTADARGIFPARGATTATKIKTSFDRFETHAVFLSDNDRKRFRIIRRRLKKFVLTLWERFGVLCDGPRFDIALTDNCRTDPRSFFRIEIHRYGQLSHAGLLEHLQKQSADHERGSPSSVGEPIYDSQNHPSVVVQSRVVFNELRLEMTHARTVDPRWPDHWVLARRMPAVHVGQLKTVQLARHVFCDRVEMPKIQYEFATPRQTLLASRFAPLYLLAEVCRKQQMAAQINEANLKFAEKENDETRMSGTETTSNENQQEKSNILSFIHSFFGAGIGAENMFDLSASSKLSATAVPFFPLNTVMNQLATANLGNSDPQRSSPQSRNTGGGSMSPSTGTAWERLLSSVGLADAPSGANVLDELMEADNRSGRLKERDGATIIARLFQSPGPSGGKSATQTAGGDGGRASSPGCLTGPSASANPFSWNSAPSPFFFRSSGGINDGEPVMDSPLWMKLLGSQYRGSPEDEMASSRPLTQQPCKFYASGDCVRGENCYFLHPADRKFMTTKMDIRHLSPVNPLFF